MKTVNLKDVFKYKDSDSSWLYKEFLAKILLASPPFIGYNNSRCMKVIEILTSKSICIT